VPHGENAVHRSSVVTKERVAEAEIGEYAPKPDVNRRRQSPHYEGRGVEADDVVWDGESFGEAYALILGPRCTVA
jgi:hypothetical protein